MAENDQPWRPLPPPPTDRPVLSSIGTYILWLVMTNPVDHTSLETPTAISTS